MGAAFKYRQDPDPGPTLVNPGPGVAGRERGFPRQESKACGAAPGPERLCLLFGTEPSGAQPRGRALSCSYPIPNGNKSVWVCHLPAGRSTGWRGSCFAGGLGVRASLTSRQPSLKCANATADHANQGQRNRPGDGPRATQLALPQEYLQPRSRLAGQEGWGLALG